MARGMFNKEVGCAHRHPTELSSACEWYDSFGFKRFANFLQFVERLRRCQTVLIEEAPFINYRHWTHPDGNPVKLALITSQVERRRYDVFIHTVFSH